MSSSILKLGGLPLLFTFVVARAFAPAAAPPVGFLVAGNNTTISGQPATRGQTLMSGDTLSVGTGEAEIAMGNGSKAGLGHDTEISLERNRTETLLNLSRGGVALSHPKGGVDVRLRAGNLSILPAPGVDTRAEVQLTKGELIVAAREGSLRVEGSGQPVNIAAGMALKFLPELGPDPQAQGPPTPPPANPPPPQRQIHWGRVAACTAAGGVVGSIPLIWTETQASPNTIYALGIPVGLGVGAGLCVVGGGPKPPPVMLRKCDATAKLWEALPSSVTCQKYNFCCDTEEPGRTCDILTSGNEKCEPVR